MLDHAREAVALSERESLDGLREHRVLQLALRKLVEIVGEAAAAVALDARATMPEIPWSQAVGMRHHLVHGYDQVDLDVLWKTVREDLPELIEVLEKLVGRESDV